MYRRIMFRYIITYMFAGNADDSNRQKRYNLFVDYFTNNTRFDSQDIGTTSTIIIKTTMHISDVVRLLKERMEKENISFDLKDECSIFVFDHIEKETFRFAGIIAFDGNRGSFSEDTPKTIWFNYLPESDV